jgi:hypothetical protein
MFSLYDQVLLFHCRCRPAFDRGRKFLNEQFADVLEFAYNDILDLTGGPDHAPAIALDPLPVTQAATSFGSGTDAPRPHHPGLKVLSPGELDQLLREQHRQTFNGFADCPHPLLEDRTPREALASDDGRRNLVEVMKITLYEIDRRNRQFRSNLEIDNLLRELNLSELILSPQQPTT